MERKKLDLVLCVNAGIFYLLNRFFLGNIADRWLGWFLQCYANDIFAGLAICAWTDLLIGLIGRRISSWRQSIPLLLVCGLVWEVCAPLWKAGAVFDPWDFLAYQAGGAVFLLIAEFMRRTRGDGHD